MKKLIALFAFVAALSFVACNNGGGEHEGDNADSTTVNQDSIDAANNMEEEEVEVVEVDSTATDSAAATEGEDMGHDDESHDESTH